MNHPGVHQISKFEPHPEVSTIPLSMRVFMLCGLSQDHMPLLHSNLLSDKPELPTCPECLRLSRNSKKDEKTP